ncbi:hypothetical protein GGE07_005967 [Sinorhizobium terangae]|uniref:Peptidase C14 caspase domain-containing protein n=1 Tax=Sinorhizobium terangae TaxID=110322 RepID=A0A6N7LK12_SINTE|nr:caspase family protein [Sinorhizobium terangae]MBB4189285.1 hypothetical protein [Sinorhizobium terangae]MQX18201.1 hypothetical protein [Sinorhizobium terangae]
MRLRVSHTLRFVSLVMAILNPAPTQADEEQFALYFVAIGSSHYAEPDTPFTNGFPRIYGANKSARFVAKRLLSGGARYGVQLTSAAGRFISVRDIHGAIDDVLARMALDAPANPLFVFYFAGHGISEGVAWSQFLVPGDFLYDGNLADKEIERLAHSALTAGNLAERLNTVEGRYLAILDACYEGQEANFDRPVLTGSAIESLKQVASVLRFMNEFHQESPVLFSTTPGSVARTVADPTGSSPDHIAPLARRITLLLDATAEGSRSLSLSQFIAAMRATDLDPATKPVITLATPAGDWDRSFLVFSSPKGLIDERVGTAEQGVLCCQTRPLARPRERTVAGSVVVEAERGEYITEGKTIRFTGELTMAVPEPGTVELTFRYQGEDWELIFDAPDQDRLAEVLYDGAGRYPFSGPGQPGVSISVGSRGCNEVHGSFQIERLEETDGQISAFTAAFEQYCDDNTSPIKGKVRIPGG